MRITLGTKMICTTNCVSPIMLDEIVTVSELGQDHYCFEGYPKLKFSKNNFEVFYPICSHCEQAIMDEEYFSVPTAYNIGFTSVKHYHEKCRRLITDEFKKEQV